MWVDKNPEQAFNRAAYILEVLEVVWDAFSILGNATVDILNAAIIPRTPL